MNQASQALRTFHSTKSITKRRHFPFAQKCCYPERWQVSWLMAEGFPYKGAFSEQMLQWLMAFVIATYSNGGCAGFSPDFPILRSKRCGTIERLIYLIERSIL